MVGALLISLFIAGQAERTEPNAQPYELARRALAQKLSISEEQVSLERVEAVDWRDTGLGCAAKGEVNQPVLTPGHRVSLRVGEKSYEVHVGGGRARVCSSGTATQGSVLSAGVRVAGLARKDLAARLGLDPRDVRIDSMKPTTWPDRNLGCAGQTEPNEAAPIKGFVLTLRVREKEYTYHADTERAVACSED